MNNTIKAHFDTLMTSLSVKGAEAAQIALVPGSTFTDKVRACMALAEKIATGQITIQHVQTAAAQASVTPFPSPSLGDRLSRAKAAQDLAAIATDAAQTQAQVRSLAEDVRKVADRIEQVSKAKATVQIDLAGIDQQVRQRIDEAFGPFKSAVEGAGAQQAVADLASAFPAETACAVDLFGVGGDLPVEVWSAADAPATDPCYIWQEGLLRHLLQSQATGENLWLGGEKGSGKTQAVQQFAARTRRPFTRINFHKTSAAEEFIGSLGLVNGATEFVPGPFLRAFTNPGAVILLDEITNCHEGELAYLNALLEPGAAVTIGGRVWSRAPGVLIVAADNTLGNGDASGRYAGTRAMNASLLDRFARAVPVTFLPRDVEVNALQKHTGCSPALADLVVDVMQACRAKVTTGDLIDAPSIRQAVAFIRALRFHPVADAWATTIAAKQPAEGMVALQAIYTSHVNAETITTLI